MSTLAFLFPGQGSQRVGMGRALQETDRDLFDRHLGLAEEISGLPLRRACLEGPIELLTRTEVAQPALFALELALLELAGRYQLRPAFVAGHSLGEYTAAVAAGCLAPIDGMRLVVERSRLMAALQDEHRGAMAAVLGPPADTVAAWCNAASRHGSVSIANLNGPAQTVVSGSVSAVEELGALAREAGARVVPLRAGGAFHSPFMRPVQARLARSAQAISWRAAAVPLASNAFGAIVSSAVEVRAAVIDQVAAPVRWVECVRALRSAGCTSFLELGPGRVLGALTRGIDPGSDVHAADSRAALATVAQRLRAMRPAA